MRMTTPNEFLQFAKEMGLGTIKSTSQSISNNDGYTATGLSVLNNLCRLIEQIHQLKAENHRLRTHLDLVDRVDKFQQRFVLNNNNENKKGEPKPLISSTSIHDEEKSETLSPSDSLKIKRSPSNSLKIKRSPSNSLKIKRSSSNREHKGNHQEDSSLILPADHEQSEVIDSNSHSPSGATWNKVRHALKFTLRRKQDSPPNPSLSHVERQIQIPTISISIDSDDDQLQETKRLSKKKRILTTNDNRQILGGEDTDQDDESMQFVRTYHKGRLDGNDTLSPSCIDRQETSSSATNLQFNTSNPDDEHLLIRKQSKIARYGRKLRSKLGTVKRQFSEQNSSSSLRLFHNSHASTFDDIGSGLNHAILSAQLAPALTKSYQQKMREWETMQKSHFLVNYRRQSLTPKIDLNNNSRKTSLSQMSNEISLDPTSPSLPIDNFSPTIDDFKLELETNLSTLDPILSPNQRSLIVHQWREIMSEEISLRHYNEYLEKKLILLKELETNLKSLKTNIFCTNYFFKQQSMINIHQNQSYEHFYFPQRCRSLQSFISIPPSWIFAVQSTAYSDILDGTSTKTTEQAILFNKEFFDRLEHFKHDRLKFEQDFINDLQLLNRSKKIPNENQLRDKPVPLRGCLRKLSLISYAEYPQYFLSDPIIPLQTIISHIQPLSNNDQHPTTTRNNELLSTINLNKQSKRSRFDLKKTFHRSRSMYMTQFHSWLQRRRQQHSSTERRKSETESKVPTPTLFHSPRLARLHQKIFKQSPSPSPRSIRTPIPVQILDDTDNRSQFELPVRIYFPPFTPPITRHVRINDNQDIQIEPSSNFLTPILHRKYTSSSSASASSTSFRMTTAKERRESFATLSNIFNNRYIINI